MRKLHQDEVVRRIEIVFAFIVDHPHVMRAGGTFIRQDLINPARHQEVSVICVDTDSKLRGYVLLFIHRSLIQELFDSPEPSTDPMRFKPVDLGLTDGPIHQAYRCHPFPLSPPAWAKSSAQDG